MEDMTNGKIVASTSTHYYVLMPDGSLLTYANGEGRAKS
jgi:hypothetical protein